MDAYDLVAERTAKALEDRITKALESIAGVVDDDKRAEMEAAIVAAVKDFEREHPLRVTVKEAEMTDAERSAGFFRCTVRAHRPSLEDDADAGIVPTDSTCGHKCYRKRDMPDTSCWSCQHCPAELK